MPRYIEAVVAADMISESMNIPLVDLVDAFAKIPSVDAVAVVRCKNCVYYNTNSCPDGCGWCEYMERGTQDEGFCDCAE